MDAAPTSSFFDSFHEILALLYAWVYYLSQSGKDIDFTLFRVKCYGNVTYLHDALVLDCCLWNGLLLASYNECACVINTRISKYHRIIQGLLNCKYTEWFKSAHLLYISLVKVRNHSQPLFRSSPWINLKSMVLTYNLCLNIATMLSA